MMESAAAQNSPAHTMAGHATNAISSSAILASSPWILRSLLAWMLMLVASALTYHARHAQPGLRRALAGGAAAVALLHVCPLLFCYATEPLLAMSAAFLCTRMTGGKVAAFILGRGALTLPDLTFWQFLAVLLAPFMPADALSAHPPPAHPQQKGVARLQPVVPLTVWQRVSPVQRFSLDRTGSGSSTGSSPSSPLDSPRIAAVRSQQDDLRDVTPPACELQQQQETPQIPLKLAISTSSGNLLDTATANLLLNAAVCAAFAVYCCHSLSALRGVVLHLSAMAVMWRAMELLMWSVSHPARAWLGMTLAPHFVNPFASTSLVDFWARRWNITQGLVLRFYVYEPIVQGCLVAPQPAERPLSAPQPLCTGGSDSLTSTKPPRSSKGSLHHRKPSPLSGAQLAASVSPAGPAAVLASPSAAIAPRWRRQLAAAATFVVSGLEHELFLWYLLGSWDGRWFLFFSLQGALLAAEGRVKRAARAAGLQLHPFVSHLAVLLVLGVCADSLFFPPLVQPAMVRPLVQSLPLPVAAWLGLA